MESYSPASYGTAGTLGFRLALRRRRSPGRDFVQAQERWYATSLPVGRCARRVFLHAGCPDRCAWPASLAVVASRGVHPLPATEFPEALSQVLLVDSTLALCAHARRIVNPEEYDGYLFLGESGGQVMLDATGLEEAV